MASGSSQIIFVHGKGGVGRTTVSRALASAQSSQKLKTAWVTLKSSGRGPVKPTAVETNLDHWDIRPGLAFEEYVTRLIPFGGALKIFLKNPIVDFLVEVAPGFRELLLLGKIWDLSRDYERVIVDLPSTGYALTMFQSVYNFNKIFKGGKVFEHTAKMLATFNDPTRTRFWIVSLPEETPIREAVELEHQLKEMFPALSCEHWVNKLFPDVSGGPAQGKNKLTSLHSSPSPLPESLEAYAQARSQLERENLKLFGSKKFKILPFCVPGPGDFNVIEGLRKPLQAGLQGDGA